MVRVAAVFKWPTPFNMVRNVLMMMIESNDDVDDNIYNGDDNDDNNYNGDDNDDENVHDD